MAAGDSTVLSGKNQVPRMLEELPDDSSFEEILRELTLERMVERGLADADAGRVISNAEMKRRVDEWTR